MNKFLGNIVALDSSYIMHRSCRAMDSLRTSSGKKSGGFYGYLRILVSQLRKMPPGYFPVSCWDDGRSQRRLDLYPDYKGSLTRAQAPPDPKQEDYLSGFFTQRAKVIEFLDAAGIPSLKFKGWEGDDLIKLISESSEHCIISSDDRDMIQMVSPSTIVYRPMQDEIYRYDTEDPNFSRRYLIAKAIVGDKSDNIPKVAKGVGSKSADKLAEWVVNHPDLSDRDALLSYPDEKLVNKIKDHLDQYELNMKLMDLDLIEVPDGFQSLIEGSIRMSYHEPDYFKMMTLLGEYEISSIDVSELVSLLRLRRGGLLNEA